MLRIPPGSDGSGKPGRALVVGMIVGLVSEMVAHGYSPAGIVSVITILIIAVVIARLV